MPDGAAARAAHDLLTRAIGRRIFPAAAAEVGDSSGPMWTEALGSLTFDDDAPPAELSTIFDLASLTKPIATTSLAMQLVERRSLDLGQLLSATFDEWRGIDRESTTLRDLLEHASGLSARLVDPPPAGRREFEHDICTMRLEYRPRSKSVYSDLGFILLGFLVEDFGGAPLPAQFDGLLDALLAEANGDDETADRMSRGSITHLRFEVPVEARARTAPTVPLDEDVRRGRILTGEVQDSYAAALGGAAGHAGLFGTAAGVGRVARVVLRGARDVGTQPVPFTHSLVARMTAKSTVPGSSRALGWDTMLPMSSCGTEMSPAAFGHVGFTGTSLWIDPVLDRYFVLLTNRACGGGSIEEMRQVRREFHNAAAMIDR